MTNFAQDPFDLAGTPVRPLPEHPAVCDRRNLVDTFRAFREAFDGDALVTIEARERFGCDPRLVRGGAR